AADLLAVHELRGVESRDLARDLRVIRRGIERGDPPDPRAAFHQPGPEGVLAGADRGGDTEPGQGNAFAHAVGPRVPGDAPIPSALRRGSRCILRPRRRWRSSPLPRRESPGRTHPPTP